MTFGRNRGRVVSLGALYGRTFSIDTVDSPARREYGARTRVVLQHAPWKLIHPRGQERQADLD